MIKNEKIKENQESYIFAFWHNKLVASTLCLDYIEKRAVLASPSKDGELISVPLEKLGYEMIRGSSDKNSTSSLISLIKYMKKGYSIGTPVDGPKGPARVVKDGVIKIAKMAGVPIVPVYWYSKNPTFAKFPSWDEMRCPIFSTNLINLYGEPIYVPQDGDEQSEENARIQLQNSLENLEKEASKAFDEVYKLGIWKRKQN